MSWFGTETTTLQIVDALVDMGIAFSDDMYILYASSLTFANDFDRDTFYTSWLS